MKRILIGALASCGLAIEPPASKIRVESLISKLHPVLTDKSLIRVGGDGDGGYLIPDTLDGVVACFSPGVSDTATFEQDIASRGIPCYLADATVDAPPLRNDRFHFTKKHLGVVEGRNTMSLNEWVRRDAPTNGDLLLQMDIEGAEWPVLLSTNDEILARFRIMVIEVHSIWQMVSRIGFQTINAVFEKLLHQFCVVHLHPNNVAKPFIIAGIPIPPQMEVTLLRRDCATTMGPATEFPHHLDRKNVANRPDVPLPRQWHGSSEKS